MSLCVFKNGKQCCSKREREKSLTTELFWMSRANVVETSQYMLQSCRMGSSTTMPTWALTTWPTFLDRLHNIVTVEDQMDAKQMRYIVIWDNIFAVVQNWFHKCPQFSLQYLPLQYPAPPPPPPPPPPPAVCQDIPHSSHGGGRWPAWFRFCARMDSPFKDILPSRSCERE